MNEGKPDLDSDQTALGGNLLFIVSLPRSGSTMTQRIFGAHPDCFTTSEPWGLLHSFYALRSSGYHAEYHEKYAYQGLQNFLSVFEDGESVYYEAVRNMWVHLYAQAAAKHSKRIFVDKTPRYYLILPELMKAFPKANVVILLRNPMAVLVSVLDTWVKDKWELLSDTPTQLDLFEGPRHLQESLERFPEITVLKYEELVEAPEEHIREVCRKTGLRFDPAMVEYGLAPKPQGTLGDPTHVDREISPTPSRKDRWKDRVASSPVLAGLSRHYFQALDPNLLKRWGYDPDEIDRSIAAGERGWSRKLPWGLLMRRPSTLPGKVIKFWLIRLVNFVESSGSSV